MVLNFFLIKFWYFLLFGISWHCSLTLKFFHQYFSKKSLVIRQYKVPSWCSRELQMLNVLQNFPPDSPERKAWYFLLSLHCCLLRLLLYFLLLMWIGSPATLCDSFIFLPGDWQFWEVCFCFWSFTIHQYDPFAWNKCM